MTCVFQTNNLNFIIVSSKILLSSTCRESWDTIVTRAKDNIRKHFIFVGITEEYQTSILLLEKLLPDYMRGLLGAYQEAMAGMSTSNFHTRGFHTYLGLLV